MFFTFSHMWEELGELIKEFVSHFLHIWVMTKVWPLKVRNGQLIWERGVTKVWVSQKLGLYPAKRNWPLILKRMDLPE